MPLWPDMPNIFCAQCGAKLPPGDDVCRVCTHKWGGPPHSETTRSDLNETLIPPVRIGPYRVLERLGEGGMGVVYLAEQERPIRRRVALKVIKLGMETREVIARFEAERQALALMDHPSIAQVYDAGATAEGRPYFAMEYVAGISITDYCDKHRLPMPARLDLFVQVCGAIQHAHQKGVIHRDIKPSNLLVSVQDGKAFPKVIDFGVAKATNQRLTEKTVFTQHGMLIGTPAYMSPEQAEMGGLDVDTTTDIYSLGVVLYELLVSAPPIDPDTLRRAGYAEIQRIIREEEPLRPSARLSGLRVGANEVALQRRTQLPKLLRELKADLDWITLKAIDKDRTRRYASASELAADVSRHLKAEPVTASPPSATYRIGKFLRRYRSALLAVALGVTVSAVVSTGIQTQNVLELTARGLIDQEVLLRQMVIYYMKSVTSRNPDTPWRVAMETDKGLRTWLEIPIVNAGAVDVVAICDRDERIVVASKVWMDECPSGRPLAELASVSVLSVLRGTIPSSTTPRYIAMSPLNSGTSEVGSIRLVFSGSGISRQFKRALFFAVISSVAQVLAVAVVAAVVSFFVFRRG